MRGSVLGRGGGHAKEASEDRAGGDAVTADRSGRRQRQDDSASVQRSGGDGADLLPVAEGVRRVEAGPGAAAEGGWEGESAPPTRGGGPCGGEARAEGSRPGERLSPDRGRGARGAPRVQ